MGCAGRLGGVIWGVQVGGEGSYGVCGRVGRGINTINHKFTAN